MYPLWLPDSSNSIDIWSCAMYSQLRYQACSDIVTIGFLVEPSPWPAPWVTPFVAWGCTLRVPLLLLICFTISEISVARGTTMINIAAVNAQTSANAIHQRNSPSEKICTEESIAGQTIIKNNVRLSPRIIAVRKVTLNSSLIWYRDGRLKTSFFSVMENSLEIKMEHYIVNSFQ